MSHRHPFLRTGMGIIALILGLVSGAVNIDSQTSVLDHELTAVNDRILALKLVNRVLRNPDEELTAAQILVRSEDDAEFATARHPESFSYWVRPTRYSMRKPINAKSTYIYIFLDRPMKDGATYAVSLSGVEFRILEMATGMMAGRGAADQAPTLSLTWRELANRSSGIHVNQAGYLPDAAKFAYITQFVGGRNGGKDKADVDFAVHGGTFRVISVETGQAVHSGNLALSAVCAKDGNAVPDPLSESRVWEADFSALQTPGTYRVHLPGVGVSYPFRIASNVFNEAAGVLFRGMYHQRCGTALTEEWTRHTHPACHLDDALVPALDAYGHDELDFFPQAEGTRRDCARGHHDAGDYGKYVINGSLFAEALLLPFLAMPERLQSDAYPVPEAGNGIPDILEEAKWELDWIANMQDPADGGVHIIVKPDPTGSYEDGLPGQPSARFAKTRSLWWKDLRETASFAAILAKAAATPDFARHYPTAPAEYLAKAAKAWDFCLKNTNAEGEPRNVVDGHHYGRFLGAKDEYCWMAAELWLATGEQRYHDYFLKHHRPAEGTQWSWWPLKDASGAATRAYLFGKRDGKDAAMLAACRDELLKAARRTTAWQQAWSTRCSFAGDAFRFGNWGWYFLSDMASYDLLLAAAIAEPDEARAFRQAALFNADQELGNNADDLSSITGFGFRRPVDHVHQHSRFDGIVEPIPGIPLGFHPAGYNRGTSDRALMASFTHGGLPIAYRYVDCWNISQEFTVPPLAKTFMTYAMLAEPAQQRPGHPELEISANGQRGEITGTAPFTVRLKAEAKGTNGKAHIRHYWDLGNEEFGCEAEFDYVFRRPGLYQVYCTVNDDDGWIRHRTLTVKVAQAAADLPRQGTPATPGDNTLARWSFDNALTDAVADHPAILVGNAALSAENTLWRNPPGGQAVKVGRCDDGVQVKLPVRLLNNPDLVSFRIEALVNYEADVPRGQGHSLLFLIEAAWDTAVGMKKDIWAGKALHGAGELNKDATFRKRWETMFVPRPGWHVLSLDYQAATGQATLAFAGESVEFPLAVGKATGQQTLHLGGFVGFIDELKIDAVMRAPATEAK
jgi:endoglucanase